MQHSHLEKSGAHNPIRMVPRKQTVHCAVRQQLADAIQQSHQQAMSLGEQEVQAVMNGDRQSLAEVETLLNEVKRNRDVAMAAFKRHIAEHECV